MFNENKRRPFSQIFPLLFHPVLEAWNIPNMVNKTITVGRTFFTGCNPEDRKFERHRRSPNKVVVGGAKGHRIWLVGDLNFGFHRCPIMKVSPWTTLEILNWACSLCVWVLQLFGWWETRRNRMCMTAFQLYHWGACPRCCASLPMVTVITPTGPISGVQPGCE